MELKIMKKELLGAVEVAENFISTERACMEHLKHVHIRTVRNDRIEIFTSDSETCAKVRINGHVEEEGKVAIPCKMFKTVLKQAPDTEIMVKAYDYKIKITAKNYTSTHNLLDIVSNETGWSKVDVIAKMVEYAFDNIEYVSEYKYMKIEKGDK